jgi:uncharacterized membrane protein
MELYKPAGFKSKSRSKKVLPNNPTKMDEKDKITNFQLQRVKSNSLSRFSFHSDYSGKRIQINANQNKQ